MSVRFRICLAVWIATIFCSVWCQSSRAEVFEVSKDWAIEVSASAEDVVKTSSSVGKSDGSDEEAISDSAEKPDCCNGVGEDYRRIYNSIPFNRAEYNVNPSYRHDSTMELLTGNARHQTILRHNTRPVVRRRSYRVIPYRYNNPARGLNYYFYFPYWNYRGIY